MVMPEGHRLVAVYPGASDAAPFLPAYVAGRGRRGARSSWRGRDAGLLQVGAPQYDVWLEACSILWVRDGAVTDDAVQFS